MVLDEIVLPARDHDEFFNSISAFFPGNPTYHEIIRQLRFTDGTRNNALQRDFGRTLRGKRVYVVASPRSGDTADVDRTTLYHLFKNVCMVASQCGAREVIAVPEEHFFGRCEREELLEEPTMAAQVAKEFRDAGVTEVITLAIHSQKQYTYYRRAYGVNGRRILHSLDPAIIQTHILVNKLRENNLMGRNMVLVRVDEGASRHVSPHRDLLVNQYGFKESQIRVAEFIKHRRIPNDPASIESKLVSAMPKLDGCLLVYFDDFFDTGGSVVSNLEDIANLKRGQPAYVFAAMPHGLLYKNAHKIIKAMGINLIASTSNPTRRTKPQIEGLPITWYDAAPYFFEEMRRGIREGIPPEKLFTPKNYPTWSVHDLYKIVQAPANLEPYHPDFSLHALM